MTEIIISRSFKKKKPRKTSKKSIENAAIFYLERFSSSIENLRRVLMRRVYRSAQYHNTNPEEDAKIVDSVIYRFIETGVLNDRHFAQMRANTLYRKGNSSRLIRSKLIEKGVTNEIISEVLATLLNNGGISDLEAAKIFARKRRLGPYRNPDNRSEYTKKDMNALARAGFGYNVALKIINAEKSSDLDEDLKFK
ncbi:MAG: regulator [Rhodospirillaceae bacterium]|nr:regulator [Rhodospirillaceae bacterium]OUT80727.1 MAG: hypothetical protein CBB83_00605 [Rhodospirillaceae bacterium TMED23]